jgi:hypothetical protein
VGSIDLIVVAHVNADSIGDAGQHFGLSRIDEMLARECRGSPRRRFSPFSLPSTCLQLVDFVLRLGNLLFQSHDVLGVVHLRLRAGELLAQLVDLLPQKFDPFLGFLIHHAHREKGHSAASVSSAASVNSAASKGTIDPLGQQRAGRRILLRGTSIAGAIGLHVSPKLDDHYNAGDGRVKMP